ncbi:glutaredoxin family protein [Evansella sp. AB-rgal1]|uniref:glutaredoxin family protein n=1 Tax=Evansella sp. AB-rgal1 TaxID=3242696 RepID=UPI00359D5ED0
MEKKVIIYTSEGCSYCSKVIEILQENNVSFEEKNISNNGLHFKEWKKKDVMGTPATFFDNNTVVMGLDKNNLLRAIEDFKSK